MLLFPEACYIDSTENMQRIDAIPMNLHDDFVKALNSVPENIKGGIDPYPDTKLNGAGMQSFVKQLRADTVIPRIRPRIRKI